MIIYCSVQQDFNEIFLRVMRKTIYLSVFFIFLTSSAFACNYTSYPSFWKGTSSKDIDRTITRLENCKTKYQEQFNDLYGNNALLTGVSYGNMKAIQYLTELGADVNYKDLAYQSVLHFASGRKNNEAVIAFLTSRGAKINEVDAFGETPIFLSLKSRSISNYVELLNLGAEINLKNSIGASLLHYASGNPQFYEEKNELSSQTSLRTGAPKFIPKQIAGDTPEPSCSYKYSEISTLDLYKDCTPNFADIIKGLIYFTDFINLQDKYGRTPLHYAAGNFNISYYLLKNGANPNIQDSYGNTPFHLWYMSCSGTAGAVPLAEKFSFDTSLKNREGKLFNEMGIGILCAKFS